MNHRPDREARGHVLAVDFGGSKVALAGFTPGGSPIAVRRVEFPAGTPARVILDRTVGALAGLRRLPAVAAAGPCLGIGVTSPGIVTEDRIRLAPNVPGWEDLALAEELRTATGIPDVVVANDVKAATRAEYRWGALRGCDPGLYVNLGTGIAAGVVIGGRVLEGAHRAAGEIAYLPVDLTGAPLPVQGLEELVGGGAIGRRAQALPRPAASARELFDRVAAGSVDVDGDIHTDTDTDTDAAALAGDVVRAIGAAVAAVVTVVDPQRVVLGGGLMAAADLVVPGVRQALGSAVPWPVDVRPAHFAHDASLRGAAALVGAPAAP